MGRLFRIANGGECCAVFIHLFGKAIQGLQILLYRNRIACCPELYVNVQNDSLNYGTLMVFRWRRKLLVVRLTGNYGTLHLAPLSAYGPLCAQDN